MPTEKDYDHLPIQRFSPTMKDRFAQGNCTMSPSPIGDWVRYDEVVKLIQKIESLIDPNQSVRTSPRCGHKIEIEGSGGIAHTYCQRAVGHEGKCSI